MEKPDKEVRAFYSRLANRLLALARECDDPRTIEQLLKSARYYLDKLQAPHSGDSKNAVRGVGRLGPLARPQPASHPQSVSGAQSLEHAYGVLQNRRSCRSDWNYVAFYTLMRQGRSEVGSCPRTRSPTMAQMRSRRSRT